MKRFLYIFILLVTLLSACGATQEQGQRKNPKNAKVQFEADTTIIQIPATTSYFFVEKVNDESVPYQKVTCEYRFEESVFACKTDLEDWKQVSPDENPLAFGLVSIDFGENDITIKYPSGTWQFP